MTAQYCILFSPLPLLMVYLLLLSFISSSQSLLLPVSLPEAKSFTIRQDGSTPVFPQDPASCPICEQNYDNINSCAAAAPVFANFSMIIFNPGAFIDIIECACTDTFQSAYPQCADCFVKTNQTSFLNVSSDDTPKIIQGIRSICAIESVLLGNVSSTDNETTPTSSAPVSDATLGNVSNTDNETTPTSSAPVSDATVSASESIKHGLTPLFRSVTLSATVALTCAMWDVLI